MDASRHAVGRARAGFGGGGAGLSPRVPGFDRRPGNVGYFGGQSGTVSLSVGFLVSLFSGPYYNFSLRRRR